MIEAEKTEHKKKKTSEVITFTVPFALDEIREVLTTNISTKISKEEIINQAFKFHSQGNISEAVKYYQDFINQGFKDPRVFSNYGDILKNQRKLQEAEIITRKAIELKPCFAEAHYNLGNILRGLGKLDEAEMSIRKAIQLKPDFVKANLKLAYLFQDIGDYENSTKKLKSILTLKDINTNDKLDVLGQLHMNSLIEGRFDEFDQIINFTNQLTTKENPFNNENFIIKLGLELKDTFESSNYSNSPYIGDSHCLSFSHQIVKLKSKKRRLIPLYIRGAKAWHFSNRENNIWKSSFSKQIQNHKSIDEIFISFGEIDCRKEEGILPFCIKYNKDIFDVCKSTINGYLNFMENCLASISSKRYYFGVPAPSRREKLEDDLDIKRKELIRLYNSLLMKEVLSMNSFFIDVYGLTVNTYGENNNLYMCDEFHLSPKCLDILLGSYLYEP